MAASDAPTHALGGTVSSFGGYGYPIDDLEHIPDLQWPQSVTTYGRLRTDPTVASILAAYVTPLIAADWSIDPRGATPEAVAICADSLGLPVLGAKTDDQGPVRRRGVKWNEHVRLAALHLVWGHFGFEPVYEVRPDGFAYLLALPERMPNTIVDIQVNDDGTMKSIVQQGQPGQKTNSYQGVEIPADRLLWYCHDREGSVYQGRSLLRACYSNWLLKLDTLRVNAIGIARFGAGTPVAEPLPGTSPTLAQVEEAQRLVSAIRVGQTGGAVPNGFTLRIKGVEGTLPDALPTLQYYDQQMARAGLTSILDLGNTATGSRALGDNFADMLQRALQSIGERMAETATELCEKLTSFNFGEDAVTPAVTVGKIGSSDASIALAVAQLVTAGAITPDASLDRFMREAFTLPPASPKPKVVAPPVALPAAAPVVPSAVPSTKAPVPVAAAAGQQRPPTPQEQAAGLDAQQIDEDHDGLVAEGIAIFAAIVLAWGTALAAQIIAAITAGSLVALARLRLKTGDAVEALQLVMHEAAAMGVRHVLDETARAGVETAITPQDVKVDLPTIDDMAEAIAEHAASGMAAAAGREAGRHGLGGDPKTTADEVVQAVSTDPVGSFISEAVARAMATGREAAMETVIEATPHLNWTIFASAIRDTSTCIRCAENDGHIYPDLETGRQAFPLGLYGACLGRTRCRCVLAMVPAGGPQ